MNLPTQKYLAQAAQWPRLEEHTLRGRILEAFVRQPLLEGSDMTDFVAEQRSFAQDDNLELLRPLESIYSIEPTNRELITPIQLRIGL